MTNKNQNQYCNSNAKVKRLAATPEQKQKNRRRYVPCGNSLYVKVQPSGFKTYIGKMRHPVKQTQLEYKVGRCDDMDFDTAYDRWKNVRKEARDKKCDPNLIENLETTHTLNEAVTQFLDGLENKIKPTTLREYRRQMNNTILPNLDANMPIKNYEWDRGGKKLIENALTKIRGISNWELERKCRSLLARTFRRAEGKQWIGRGQNPVTTERDALDTPPEPKHYPMLKWGEVPTLIERLETFGFGSPIQQVLVTKFILLTGLRCGAAARLRWDAIDYEEGIITIDGTTSGLKRVRGKNDNIPHLIPLTEEIIALLETAKKYCWTKEYVFSPIKQSRYPHIDPEAPNNMVRKLGVKNSDGDTFVIHGWRRTFLTEGQDQIKGNFLHIKKQLGHLPEGKVNKVYDASEHIEERREFLDKWGKSLVAMGLSI